MTPTTGHGGYADYEAARRAYAALTGEPDIVAGAPRHLREAVLMVVHSGSGGIIPVDADYHPFSFRIESSPCVVVSRPVEPTSDTGAPHDSIGLRDILRLSMVEQMQELQAALSLNKSQLARVLRVSRPTLYDWFRGKEPSPANTDRLHAVLRCLVKARASGTSPLNARFVRQPANLDGPALLDLLFEEQIDEDRVVGAIAEAQALGDAATRRRATREERLRNLGFEDPGREQRREQLARNMALRDWPNR